jgi:AraC-like DNA-binding protein
MSYREQPTALRDAVLWQRTAGAQPAETLILPDGCLDLIWDGGHLFVAGPDTRARRHTSPIGARYVALRFSAGLGARLLDVPADELSDRSVEVDDLLTGAEARILSEKVAADPVPALTSWLQGRASACAPDALGPRLRSMAGAGLSVAAMADQVAMSPRQLQRRCLSLFGYGPRHLVRVLRLAAAVERARSDQPLAAVAVDSGYCDQAHLSREVRALTGVTPTRLISELDRS